MWKKSLLVLGLTLITLKSSAAELNSADIKAFGNTAELTFGVVSNFGEEGKFTACVKINNRSPISLPAGKSNWKIYLHSVRRILSTASTEFTLSRIQGDLYEMSPTEKFKGLKAGHSLTLEYIARAHITSYSDFMPRAFIANNSGHAVVFANTNTEALSEFVAPFAQPEQFLRFDTPVKDAYGVVTTEARYKNNLSMNFMLYRDSQIGILPTPKTIKYSNGKVNIDNTWTIRESGGLRFEVDYLQTRMADMGLGIPMKSEPRFAKEKVIELVLDNRFDKPEAYELDITTTRVSITAGTDTGIFYGIQSLLSLFPAAVSTQYSLPALRVFDAPRYAWRGMHYDIARNFHGKQSILMLIEQMSRYKLNKLHLHLTDDEGWRLEIPGLPELTDIGAYRCFDLTEEKCLLTQLGSGPDKNSPGNGYLTTADFIDIVRYAAQRHIEVIPEIDMPGHARAAIKSMEARYKRLLKAGKANEAEHYLLSDPQDKSSYLTVQSYSDNAINVCLPSTYVFVEKILYELQLMYRKAGQKLNVFHMGGDEVGVGSWTESPACNTLFATQETGVMGVADLKPYFVRKVAELSARRGLSLAGWEDGLMYDAINTFDRSQFPNHQVIANAWDNIWEAGVSDRAYRLANAGYDVIISAATHLYFDHPHEANAYERGYHWATRYTDLAKVFSFMPDDLYANADRTFTGEEITNLNALVGRVHPRLEKPKHVLGIQGQVWTETIRTSQQLEEMVFPRLIALAERAWFKADWENATPDKELLNVDWSTFINTLVTKELPKLEEAGVHFYLPPPGAMMVDQHLLANSSLPGVIIEYSLDNGKSWQEYTKKIFIESKPIWLRTRLNNTFSRAISLPQHLHN